MSTTPALPGELEPLAILRTARQNAAAYYAPLLHSENDVLRIGAWTALLDRNEVSYSQYPDILRLAGENPGIRRRAFRHFMTWCDYAEAATATRLAPAGEGEAEAEAALEAAELAADRLAQVAAQRSLYLATGRPELLGQLIKASERAAGWRSALPVAVDNLVLHPHDAAAAMQLLGLLDAARQPELMQAVLRLLAETGLHALPAALFGASVSLMNGNPAGCLAVLPQLSAMRVSRPDIAASVRVKAAALRAEALEKTGDYRGACAAYEELNRLDQGKPYDLAEFGRTVLANAALNVPALPPDPRGEAIVMTGFPRSGTTLLENALAAHPLVETFEEIASWSSMQLFIDLVVRRPAGAASSAPLFLKTRERYYTEIDRMRRKPEASVLVDKMPIASAQARFLARLFPDKRYIFSIRHPFDVVLSCFKQQFVRNIAMEHFRTFEGAVKLYDFTMTQWFGVHGLDDPKVHYVRYDDLVTAFEPTVRGVLDFIGVGWDPAVLGFAEAAQTRATKTPSYQKVRQGLSIGVQTMWRHYGFLFESEAARPLRKWVGHFGYEAI